MPYFGIYLYIISLYIRPQDWVGWMLNFPIDDLIFGIIIVTGVGKLHNLKEVFTRPQTKFFLWWLLWILLSCFTSGLFADGISQFVAYFKFFLLYLIAALYVDSFAKLRALIIFMIFVTTVLVIQSIDQWNVGVGWAGQTLGYTETKGYRIRWIGLWDGYNVLCMLFILGMAFIMQYWFKPAGLFKRLFWIGIGGLTLYAIYLTKSRGGIIGLVGVFGYYFNDLIKSRFIKLFLVPSLAGMALMGVMLFGGTDDKEHSASQRVALWGDGLEMVKYEPIFGVGKGTFKEHSGSLIAHSSYIEILAETGFVGFFFWVSLVYSSLKGLWLTQTTLPNLDPANRALGRGIIAGLSGYLMASLFLTTEFELFYFIHALAGAYCYMCGISLTYDKEDAKRVVKICGVIVVGYWILTTAYFG